LFLDAAITRQTISDDERNQVLAVELADQFLGWQAKQPGQFAVTDVRFDCLTYVLDRRVRDAGSRGNSCINRALGLFLRMCSA
jgi:hypothetical protein